MLRAIVLSGCALLATAALSATVLVQGDANSGRLTAERWCSACHLVGPEQTTALADAPTFQSIAERSDTEIEALAGFLADPHPPMPDMSLTRSEIRDLLAYIASLR